MWFILADSVGQVTAGPATWLILDAYWGLHLAYHLRLLNTAAR